MAGGCLVGAPIDLDCAALTREQPESDVAMARCLERGAGRFMT